MDRKWIAIITGTDAKFFSERPFRRVAQLQNRLGREKNRALAKDKPGVRRPRFSGSTAIHGLSGQTEPSEDVALAFAKEIGEFIHRAFSQNRFGSLTVVAEPKTLGRVKKEIDKHILRDAEFITKDLGGLKNHEIADALGLERPRPRIMGRPRLSIA